MHLPSQSFVHRRPLIGDPPETGFVIALCALFLLTGLFGRDPWKGDDALHIAVALGFAREPGWLIPTLAGQIWLDTPPLFHWIASFTGRAATVVGASFADGVRLTSALFTGLWLLGSAGAARELYGAPAARIAPLIAIASIGAVTYLHDAQAATTLLAALGLGMWALALIARRPLQGGVVLTLALAVSGLGTGLWLTAILLLTAALMPLLPVWRTVAATPRRMLALPLAMLAGTALAASWYIALRIERPELASRLWNEDLASLLPDGALLVGGMAGWMKVMAWYAWPALPIAGWALWQRRSQWRSPVLTLPLLLLLLLFVQLAGDSAARNQRALPLLAPLVVLGSAGLPKLRRGAANALDWFGVMTFSLLGVIIWLGWVAMYTGWPARLAKTFARLEPGFSMPFYFMAVSLAAIMSLAWIWLLWRSPRTPTRGAVSWGCGMVLIWFLVSSLWLPWIDYGRSYRDVAKQLADHLPEDRTCVAYTGLQESQRAAFYYFTGLKPLAYAGESGRRCTVLIAHYGRGGRKPALDAGWTLKWEGRRPGDRHERFLMYMKNPT